MHAIRKGGSGSGEVRGHSGLFADVVPSSARCFEKNYSNEYGLTVNKSGMKIKAGRFGYF